MSEFLKNLAFNLVVMINKICFVRINKICVGGKFIYHLFKYIQELKMEALEFWARTITVIARKHRTAVLGQRPPKILLWMLGWLSSLGMCPWLRS